MSVPPGSEPEVRAAQPPPAADTTLSLGAVTPVEVPEAPETGLNAADEAAVAALPTGSALLVVQRGPNAGARFLLDADRTTAGRRPDSDIFLDDVTVSRRHAEFLRREGYFVVRDVGSLNGTYVQRDRIDEAVLRVGDEVQIGKYRLVFHPSPRTQPAPGGDRDVVGAAAGRRGAPRPSMSIGEVLAVLRPEFSDVTISKIRFLEEQGLVEPERTASGYRKFTHADVERLRYVLSRQRDQYLPLRVIREHLDAIDRGLEPEPLPGGPPRVPRLVEDAGAPGSARFGRAGRDLRLSRQELLEAADIEEPLLTALESHALVTPRVGPTPYDGEALVIARTAGELAAFGIEPRHLRPFRTAADREAGLVEQVVAPLRRQRDTEAAARAEETAREVAAACVRLHASLVKAALERGTR